MPDTVILVVRYESSGRYLRSKGEIVEVQEGDGEPRPPTNPDPDAAGRWLEEHGYQFDATVSRWLDRIGTTLRPRRKQIFRLKGDESDETPDAERAGT